jgi:hypothetical protein
LGQTTFFSVPTSKAGDFFRRTEARVAQHWR